MINSVLFRMMLVFGNFLFLTSSSIIFSLRNTHHNHYPKIKLCVVFQIFTVRELFAIYCVLITIQLNKSTLWNRFLMINRRARYIVQCPRGPHTWSYFGISVLSTLPLAHFCWNLKSLEKLYFSWFLILEYVLEISNKQSN